jgi:hypothetical protein
LTGAAAGFAAGLGEVGCVTLCWVTGLAGTACGFAAGLADAA